MNLVEGIHEFIWGLLVDWILFVGVYLTLGLDFIPLRLVPHALRLWWAAVRQPPEGEGETGPFLNSMAALGGMIGMGNVTGVAAALVVGGPGVLIWVWIGSLVGFATKFAETLLSTEYRTQQPSGHWSGGPMYYLGQAMPAQLRWFGPLFAVAGAVAMFGVGNTLQSQQLAAVLQEGLAVPPLLTGVVMAGLTYLVIIGGLRRIGLSSAWLITLSVCLYVLGCLAMVIPHLDELPTVLATILQQGLSLRAIASGTILVAISNGIRLGVLSNEAGMGTSPIILSVGRPGNPFYQACISMLLSLADVVVCTATGFVVLLSGSYLRNQSPVEVVKQAFDWGFPGSHWLLVVAAIPFTFTTFTAFAYYGERCLEYLCGERSNQIYRLLWVALIVIGAVIDLDIIWKSTEVLNALVALPNIIGIVVLSTKIFEQTRSLLPPRLHLNQPKA